MHYQDDNELLSTKGAQRILAEGLLLGYVEVAVRVSAPEPAVVSVNPLHRCWPQPPPSADLVTSIAASRDCVSVSSIYSTCPLPSEHGHQC